MAITATRQGYLGLAIESVAGTAEASPDVFIPYTDNSLADMHEKLSDISSRATRVETYDAREGRKWSEGDVELYLDAHTAGYMFKLALGGETKTVVGGTPEVNDHQFYITASGNTPKTATLWNYRGTGPSVKRSTYNTIDTLELEVSNDGIATLTANFLGKFPTKVSAPALTTTSGTLLAWPNTEVRFGTDLQDALGNDPTKVESLTLTVENGAETHFRSGSAEVDAITYGATNVVGDYTIFFEDDTELDVYRELDKRTMVVDITGANIGNGYQERIRMVVHRMFLEEAEPDDIDDMFALNPSLKALQGTVNPGYFDVTVRNLKTDLY